MTKPWVTNGAIEPSDLDHLAGVGLASRLLVAIPAPRAKGRPYFNITRFVERDGRTIHDVVAVRPVYYEARDHSMRPLSEIAHRMGNRSIVLAPWADALMHPRYKAWLAKRCKILGGTLTILGGTGVHNRASKAAEHALYEVAAGMRGRRFVETTVYPDPNPETATVDGRVTYNDGGAGCIAWATIRGASAGHNAYPSEATNFWLLETCGAGGGWHELDRMFWLFDTSAIPDINNISLAVISLYFTAKTDSTGGSWSDAQKGTRIVASTPASNTDLVTGDFDQVGGTEFASKVYGDITTSAYNAYTLNDTGRATVSKTGVTKFGGRIGADLDNSEPTNTPAKSIDYRVASADTADVTSDPKLVVTHSAPVSTLGFLTM